VRAACVDLQNPPISMLGDVRVVNVQIIPGPCDNNAKLFRVVTFYQD
jgi:hypothetical protein